MSFNPRPRRGAGATRIPDPGLRLERCFNPRPRRGAGATCRQHAKAKRALGFNPRPRRGAGATSLSSNSGAVKNVSILARAEARALPVADRGIEDHKKVSILARAEARALRP